MEVVFIGNNFYQESATMMSSVYELKNGRFYRTDWGFIEIALENGNSVNIRPANEFEMETFLTKLEGLKK